MSHVLRVQNMLSHRKKHLSREEVVSGYLLCQIKKQNGSKMDRKERKFLQNVGAFLPMDIG